VSEQANETPRVVWITLTPVKSLALRSLDAVELTRDGAQGDRRFLLIDADGRLFNGKRCGRLALVDAAYDETAGTLRLSFPDGTVAEGEIAFGETLDASLYREPRSVRVVVGPWSEALSDYAGQPIRLVAPVAGQLGVDRKHEGAASLLGTGSLRALARSAGVEWVDPHRFRMLFGIDGVEPFEEDRWVGRAVRIGAATVTPIGNVGRCAVTTQNPRNGIPDLDTLRVLNGLRNGTPTSEPLPFGVYGQVVVPGRVAVGDAVEVL
jgi:uncharacterized protein YcbX